MDGYCYMQCYILYRNRNIQKLLSAPIYIYICTQLKFKRCVHYIKLFVGIALPSLSHQCCAGNLFGMCTASLADCLPPHAIQVTSTQDTSC